MGLQSAEPWNLKVGMVKSRESTMAGQGWSSQVDRKRGRPLGSKSKRLRLDTDEALFLKSNWEEAQELLRPPPSAIPTTITIDGHEFEEYAVLLHLLKHVLVLLVRLLTLHLTGFQESF